MCDFQGTVKTTLTPEELAVELYCLLRTKYHSQYYTYEKLETKPICKIISYRKHFLAVLLYGFVISISERKRLFLAKPRSLPAAANVEDGLVCILIRTEKYFMIKSECPVHNAK